MKEKALEVLYILAYSTRTQVALILGVVLFTGIHLYGNYYVSTVEFTGVLSGLNDALTAKIARRYDKVALGALISSWWLAYRFYQRDKARFC